MKNVLESNALSVVLNEDTREFVITDKRIGKVWTQAPIPSDYKLGAMSSDGSTLKMEIEGEIPFTLTVALENECELLYTLSADPDKEVGEIAFPPAIQSPDNKHYVLQTDSEGLLLPVDDCFYPLEQQPIFRCSGGPGMAWIGMVDDALEAGFMNIYETPYDADIKMHKVNDRIVFQIVWLPSLGKFAYERKMRAVFFDKGGYVAQCKRYRPYAWAKNGVQPFTERVKRFPTMKKMLGAVHVYVWKDARTKEFIEEMKESGIDNAMVIWNPNHVPYPEQDFTPAIKDAGYASGGYELFTDIHPRPWAQIPKTGRKSHSLTQYHQPFEYLTAKTKDGDTYHNQFGHYICPLAVKDEIKDRIDEFHVLYPEETYFIDVYQANGIYECYDERHPLTREGYAMNLVDNMKLMEDRYGVYIGGEFGADYGAGHGAYVHGMMTLQRTWFGSAVEIPGSIYYYGRWSPNDAPSIMVGSRTATPTYHKYGINEYTRLPLYELVYHDAVVTSWRWEDGNHHNPEIWWKKDLFNVLYGNSPLWSIDRPRFTSFKTNFIESYKKVIPWIKQICYDEMVSHRFVTEDHKVQESIFSSGKSVVVNFGDKDYVHNGVTISARDFVAFGV